MFYRFFLPIVNFYHYSNIGTRTIIVNWQVIPAYTARPIANSYRFNQILVLDIFARVVNSFSEQEGVYRNNQCSQHNI